MYIIKNALRCISRSKGRNILIGIITLVIAVSACLGLSIRQAAESAKETTLEGLAVTATISFDRQSVMNDIDFSQKDNGDNSGEDIKQFDRSEFKDMMNNASSLTLDEYLIYADADSVKDFYYTLTASFNGNDDFEAVTTDTSEETTDTDSTSDTDIKINNEFPGMGGENGGGNKMSNMMGMSFSSGDFSVIGYSGENAMADFVSGVASVTDGEVFEEGTDAYTCIISEELAIFNGISVGDTITLANPENEDETYTLTVSGIYTNSQSNDNTMSMFSTSQDPANQIYMSAAALQKIIDTSEAYSGSTVSEEESETSSDTSDNANNTEDAQSVAVMGTISATYVFADTDAYYQFTEEVYELGLDESYTVSSTDISSYESSLTPLETLSTMAGWFLIVILAIGAVVLVVLNIFNVRERKYEIGVLTAMGMKKSKVAIQFITEILVVTMVAVVLGACVGGVSSVPVTNALLENQISSQQTQSTQIENNFGRGGDVNSMENPPSDIKGGGDMNFENMFDNAQNYITEVDSAMNITVVLQMLGIGLLLTLVASAFSVLFVMRYDPLKILANRD